MIYIEKEFGAAIPPQYIRAVAESFHDNLKDSLRPSIRAAFGVCTGTLSDLAIFDAYISESPEEVILADKGVGVATCIASILVHNCGFVAFGSCQTLNSIRHCVLENEEAGFLFFPWHQFMQFAENTKGDEPCTSLWIDIIKQQNASSRSVPSSWHPLFEIAYNVKGGWPRDLVSLARQIVDWRPHLIDYLSDAFEWNQDTPHELIRHRLQEIIDMDKMLRRHGGS